MKTRAIILKKINTNEHDQLITCYTQELGKITTIAKSILKKSSIQAMHLDLFNLVNFELVTVNSYPIITGAEAENTHLNIKSSMKAISTAFVLGEYVDKLTFEYSKDEDLWDFLVEVFACLNEGTSDTSGLLVSSQKKLLNILGYYSDFQNNISNSDLHLTLENIAGQQLKSINFFHRVNAVLR